MTYILSIFVLCLSGALIWLTRKHLYTLEKYDDLVEQVEESLDIIDQSYNRMSKLLETPVLFDDPIAVEMVNSAKMTRDSMLLIANKITNGNEDE